MANGPHKHPPLRERLNPDLALRDLMGEVGGAVRCDFAGVAIRPDGTGSYKVAAAVDRRREGRRKENRSFPVAGTAAAWVEQTEMPFIGRELGELRRFEQTVTDMALHGFASNVIMPLDCGDHRNGIFYLLSTSPMTYSFDVMAVVSRISKVLEPLTQAWLAVRDLEDGKPIVAESGSPPPSPEVECTLAELERQHVAAVLRRCNGVIEGPRGAAIRLGVKPSTLRARLRKLGLR